MGQPNSQPETFTNVQPIAQQETFSNVTPIDAPPESWLHKTFAPRQVPQAKPTGEMPGSFEGHPENVGEYVPATAGEMIGGGKDVARGDISKGMHRIISGAGNAVAPVVLPFVGAAAPAATAWALVTGAAGQQIGKRGAQALGASEDQSDLAGDVTGLASGYGGSKVPSGRLAKVIGKVGKGALEDIPGVRQVLKARQYWNETAPPPAPPTPPAPEFGSSRTMPGQVAPEVINPQPKAAPPIRRGQLSLPEQTPSTIEQAVESPARTLQGENPPTVITRPQPARPIPSRSGLALPAAPKGAELADLPTPAAKPAAQTGEALKSGTLSRAMQKPTVQSGQLSEAMKPQPAEVAPGFQRGSLQKLLDESVGAKRLDPKVSLRQQMPAKTAPTEAPADLPEGHTPVQSSAVKSFKYDPAAREFHAKATSGNTVYVYGDVAPEEADAFSKAESKGKAWQSIRQNPLVAKIVDGKRIAVKAAQ